MTVSTALHAALLAELCAVGGRCQAATTGFSDEQAAQGVALADELRAIFLARLASSAASTPGYPAAATLLQILPSELLAVILSTLDTRSLACLAATCLPLWLDAPTPASGPRDIGPVEAELRQRDGARGLEVGSSLPEGSTSWVSCLLKRGRRDAQKRQAPLAAGMRCSIFVDAGGRLLTCGWNGDGVQLLGHAVDPDANVYIEIGSPTPVPTMQDKRIVSIAASDEHCLALSAEGEVYSWGDGTGGSLGHADGGARAVPSRIESLSRIESIAAGTGLTSAAVDEDGKLFTWGRARFGLVETMPNGLGYALDSQIESQLTPKSVEALSEDRVVGVALGWSFTLAVTDAGAVFSFGYNEEGVLGHGSLEAEALPRRIEALAQTGRRYVPVAAGESHALALTEEGELYGWGHACANGHGRDERTPCRVAALIGERVKLMDTGCDASCAVTEKGELFTWSQDGSLFILGHGVDEPQATPKRVEGLGEARIAAVSMCRFSSLVADEDGVVWAFGPGSGLSLDDPNPDHVEFVKTPTPIPTLQVRALKSP